MTGHTVTAACGYTLTVTTNPPAPPPAEGASIWCPGCGAPDIVAVTRPGLPSPP